MTQQTPLQLKPPTPLQLKDPVPYNVVMCPNPFLVAAQQVDGKYVLPGVVTEIITKPLAGLKLRLWTQLDGQKQLRNHEANISRSILANEQVNKYKLESQVEYTLSY